MNRELSKFLDLIFGEHVGFVYAAIKRLDGKFQQNYFPWPAAKSDIESFVDTNKETGEIYFCPSLFQTPSGQKTEVMGSRVAWVDFDYGVPESWGGIPEPNIMVRTSNSDHVHAYWNLNGFRTPNDTEELNRRLAYHFEADTSGWDCNQLLRLPETRNHKRSANVILLQGSPASFNMESFSSLPPSTTFKVKGPVEEILKGLPVATTVLVNHPPPIKLRRLLTEPSETGKRSSALMALGYGLAEMGLTDGEILALLIFADEVHQKFVDRPDRLIRLIEIVGRAREKVATSGQNLDDVAALLPKKLSAILQGKTQLQWIWKPYLFRRGSMILSGPPGVGKSQFGLSLQQSLVLGTEFLEAPVGIEGLRVGFLSLEMDTVELLYILKEQTTRYDTDEMQLLDNNAVYFPLGFPLNFTNKETQDLIKEALYDCELDGLIIDSLSSCTPKELASEEEAKRLFAFDAYLRQTFNIFTLYLHHNRKAQTDNRKPVKLSDLHGSVHLAGKASSILFLWPEANSEISVITPKVRLSAIPPEFRVRRNADLRLEKVSGPALLTVTKGGEEVYKDASPDGKSDIADGGTIGLGI